jgi:signal transduction histidine kinase
VVTRGVLGELFWHIPEAVLVTDDAGVRAWNPGAEALFGVSAEEATRPGFDLSRVFGRASDDARHLIRDGASGVLECDGGCDLALFLTAWHLGEDLDAPSVVVLRDVSADHHQLASLTRLNEIGRRLLAEDAPESIFQRIVDEAKHLLGADFSALIILRSGSQTEIANFAYNAPRSQFPDRLPRCVGLLAVPIQTGKAARLADIRGHPGGVGIPVEHPPIAPLLAVPVMGRDAAVGELAVANGPGRREFDEADEVILTELAAHAALAISVAASRLAERAAHETQVGLTRLALHDLRTPLAIATGSAKTLRENRDRLSVAQNEELFDAMERALARIDELAEGLVMTAREPSIEGGPTTEQSSSALIGEVIARLSDLATCATVTVEYDVTAGDRVTVDAAIAGHALENLLTNAIKHSVAGDTVVVTCRPGPASVRFDVTDHGPGIPVGEQARIFEGLYRTELSRTSGLPGAGIGLSTVRRLLEGVGGAIGVTSQPGQGATFWFTVPSSGEGLSGVETSA